MESPNLKMLLTRRTAYTAQYVEGLRQPLAAVIDCLISANHLQYAASLKEIDLVIQHYIEEIQK